MNNSRSMRRLIQIVEERLPASTNCWGKDFVAFENPTEEEFIDALKNSKCHALRCVLFDNGEIIVWDSEAALHSDVDAAYGTSGGYNITIWSSHIDVQGNPKREVRAAIKNNHTLVKLGINRLRTTG